jgi:hypothetical protein
MTMYEYKVKVTRVVDGDTVDIMIEEGHCVPYFGGSKEDTQEQHAANRKRLVESGVVTLPKGMTL